MPVVEQIPETEGATALTVSEEQRQKLSSWLTVEIEDALSSRAAWDRLLTETQRQYEAVPKTEKRNTPIEDAPNFEVPIGAIVADSVYAQAIDLIFGVSPVLSVRAINGKTFVNHAKALQRFANSLTGNITNFRPALEHTILDDVQAGTGVLYVPWVEHVKKTDVQKVLNSGPRIISVPPEDVIVPGGAYEDIQRLRWIGIRTWPTESDLHVREARSGWDIDGVQATAAKGFIRTRREQLARTSTSGISQSKLFETIDVYCNYDIDGDGIDESLLVFFDRTSRKVMKVAYAPYDRTPIEKMCYQIRPHLFYGIGPVEMVSSLQSAITDTVCYWTLNMLLANTRLVKSRTGALPSGTMRVWPYKNIEVPNPEDIDFVEMADVYNSGPLAVQMLMQLTERRTGVDASSFPRASQGSSSRTPATTMLSLLQQVNRRFTPAFAQMRTGAAGAIKQCLYRYQERLLAGDAVVENWIRARMGEEEGNLIIEILKNKAFDDEVSVELTASSSSVNRDLDKQNMMMLVNILIQYYQRILELAAIATSEQTPEPVRKIATQIAEKSSEVIDRVIRTFDQIRDPASFIVEMEDAMAEIEKDSTGGIEGFDINSLASQFGPTLNPSNGSGEDNGQ